MHFTTVLVTLLVAIPALSAPIGDSSVQSIQRRGRGSKIQPSLPGDWETPASEDISSPRNGNANTVSKSQLNDKSTFRDFGEGTSNKLTTSPSFQVSKNLGGSYNPSPRPLASPQAPASSGRISLPNFGAKDSAHGFGQQLASFKESHNDFPQARPMLQPQQKASFQTAGRKAVPGSRPTAPTETAESTAENNNKVSQDSAVANNKMENSNTAVTEFGKSNQKVASGRSMTLDSPGTQAPNIPAPNATAPAAKVATPLQPTPSEARLNGSKAKTTRQKKSRVQSVTPKKPVKKARAKKARKSKKHHRSHSR